MSVIQREVPFEVAGEGGFPTAEEFESVWQALSDVLEFGIEHLLSRIAAPLVEAYEAENKVPLDVSYEHLGLLTAKGKFIVGTSEDLLKKAQQLTALAHDLVWVVESNGEMQSPPAFDKWGTGEYQPSQAALERWGFVKAKADDAS